MTDALDLSPRAPNQPDQLRRPLSRNSTYPFPWPKPRQGENPAITPDRAHEEEGGSLWRGLAWASALGAVFWLVTGFVVYRLF